MCGEGAIIAPCALFCSLHQVRIGERGVGGPGAGKEGTCGPTKNSPFISQKIPKACLDYIAGAYKYAGTDRAVRDRGERSRIN